MKRIAILLAVAASTLSPARGADVEPGAPRYLLRGTVSMDRDVLVFRTCGDKGREYTLVDDTRGDLAGAYKALAAPAGAPLFMEVRGVVLQAPGAAADTRPALHAEKVERAERQGPGCRRALGRLEALVVGSSPAWQVEVAPSGVTFASLDDRGTLMFPARTGAWPVDGALRYEGQAGDATLSLSLEPERCRDGLTGNLFAYAARAVLNGTEYRGCAIRGRTAVTSATKPAR